MEEGLSKVVSDTEPDIDSVVCMYVGVTRIMAGTERKRVSEERCLRTEKAAGSWGSKRVASCAGAWGLKRQAAIMGGWEEMCGGAEGRS